MRHHSPRYQDAHLMCHLWLQISATITPKHYHLRHGDDYFLHDVFVKSVVCYSHFKKKQNKTKQNKTKQNKTTNSHGIYFTICHHVLTSLSQTCAVELMRRSTVALRGAMASFSTSWAKLAPNKNNGWLYEKQKKNKPMCYPQQLGRSWKVFVPEPSRTLFAMCTGILRNLISHRRNRIRNLISHLHRNLPEPCLLSAPDPSGTIRILISHLRRNRPEPHQLSAPEPSGTFRNPPEPSPEPRVAAAPDRTRAILG